MEARKDKIDSFYPICLERNFGTIFSPQPVVGQFAIGGRAILPAAGFQPALAA
jgi:hypothetical protein